MTASNVRSCKNYAIKKKFVLSFFPAIPHFRSKSDGSITVVLLLMADVRGRSGADILLKNKGDILYISYCNIPQKYRTIISDDSLTTDK
jgi:hypothetical protein